MLVDQSQLFSCLMMMWGFPPAKGPLLEFLCDFGVKIFGGICRGPVVLETHMFGPSSKPFLSVPAAQDQHISGVGARKSC